MDFFNEKGRRTKILLPFLFFRVIGVEDAR